jgi:hypothetical protein
MPKLTPLQVAEKELEALKKELELSGSCDPALLVRIKRAECRVTFRKREESKAPPVDTSLPDGTCKVCTGSECFPCFGDCKHATDFCGACIVKMARDARFVYNPYGWERTSIDAFNCPFCRAVIATTPEHLVVAKALESERIAHRERIERERLEDQRRAIEFERRQELERQEQRAEQLRVSEINRLARERIIARVREREAQRRMVMRGELVPVEVALISLPTPVRCCHGNCSIPMQGRVRDFHHPGFQPQVVVTPDTTCNVCRQSILSAWDQQAVVRIRAEEDDRLDEMYRAAQVDQERRRLFVPQLEARSRLVDEVIQLERPFRERLERELAAAGDNVAARERAQQKFDRDLEEAQRKWSRKNRRRG